MSAETRHKRNEDLAKLASLYSQAVGFVERGKRSPQQVYALLSSLQFFKENRLLTAVPQTSTAFEPEQLQQLLSLKLSETHINRKTLACLKRIGVEYVGEIYVINWGYSDLGKSAHTFSRSLGLPEDLDLKEVDWVPPYADKLFFWRMDQPLVLFLNEKIQGLDVTSLPSWIERRYRQYFSTEYTGQWFQRTKRSRGYGEVKIDDFDEIVRPDSKLRAGMYCPKSWVPPASPPK